MVLKILKAAFRVLGFFCMAETMSIKLSEPMTKLQNSLSAKFKQCLWAMVQVGIAIVLLNLAFHFVLLGLAHLLNKTLESSCLGFFMSAMVAFVLLGITFWRIGKKLS